MPGTIVEQVVSRTCGRDVRAGDIVICAADVVIGTDASTPMAVAYFDRMNGSRFFDPSRVLFALDHYAPGASASTSGFHDIVRAFASRHGADVFAAGEGISHQVAVERGRVSPGDLVVGADSHTVMCGALNLVAIGVGSSDLAAALITGQVWLRVPETIRVWLQGTRPAGVSAKDVALAVLAETGADGADYLAVEFAGDGLASFTIDDRMVLTSLSVEMGAKAAIGPYDDVLQAWLGARGHRPGRAVVAASDARYVRELVVDLGTIGPKIALPHAPDRVAPLADAVGTRVQMVFIGTCTGGRAPDIREALEGLRSQGGAVADGVTLVITPASRLAEEAVRADGTLDALVAAGAVVTSPGCGACCGTSGVIPSEGATVVSTANRNFKGRMGRATASIYLASPFSCGAAAAAGHIVSGDVAASLGRER